MKLTDEANQILKDANTEDVRMETTDLANQQYIKNLEVIREIDALQYRYDILEGEIQALERKKQRIYSILKAHVVIVLILGIVWVMFFSSPFIFSIYALPFIMFATIMELVKIGRDLKPYIRNLSMFRETMELRQEETMDIAMDAKKIEQASIQSRINQLRVMKETTRFCR